MSMLVPKPSKTWDAAFLVCGCHLLSRADEQNIGQRRPEVPNWVSGDAVKTIAKLLESHTIRHSLNVC
jgi:hypothetical protein